MGPGGGLGYGGPNEDIVSRQGKGLASSLGCLFILSLLQFFFVLISHGIFQGE